MSLGMVLTGTRVKDPAAAANSNNEAGYYKNNDTFRLTKKGMKWFIPFVAARHYYSESISKTSSSNFW